MKYFLKNEKMKQVLLLFIVTSLIFSFVYSLYPAAPGPKWFAGIHENQGGWKLWYDQGQYYKESAAIANGSFDTNTYIYPLGYVVLGVPFVIGQEDSFISDHRYFIPNLIMLLAITFMTYDLTLRLTKNIKISLLSLAFLFFLTFYLIWFVEPQTVHVFDIALVGVFYIFFRNLNDISNWQLLIAGLLAGWVFAGRYYDLIWLFPFFISFLILKPKKFVYFLPGVFLIILTLGSHFVIFGDPFTVAYQYNAVFDDQGKEVWGVVGGVVNWNPVYIAGNIYCVLLEPLHCLPEKTGIERTDQWWYYALFDKTPILASSSAFLIFSPLGIYLIMMRTHGYSRLTLILLIGTFTAFMIVHGAIWGFSGWTRFFRYHMVWFPLFTIFSIYGMYYLYEKLIIKILRSKN